MSTITLQPNDTVITGSGSDTLVIFGFAADYIVEQMGDGYRLINVSSGSLGSGTNAVLFSGIGNLQFNDGQFSPSQFAAVSFNSQASDTHDASATLPDNYSNGVVFNGGSGNDVITGSAGTRDVAMFSGNLADYWISNTNGMLQVRDLRTGLTPLGNPVVMLVQDLFTRQPFRDLVRRLALHSRPLQNLGCWRLISK